MSGRRGRIIIDSRADKQTSNLCAKSYIMQELCKDFSFVADIVEKCILRGLFLGCKEFLPSEYVTKTHGFSRVWPFLIFIQIAAMVGTLYKKNGHWNYTVHFS